MKVVIPGTLPGLNDYIRAERGNRYAAASMKKKVEKQILWFLPNKSFRKPVHITYRWHEPARRRDLDNIAFAKKFIQDALVKAGVLENDGWRHIVGFSDTFTVDKHNPRVEIEIKEVE